MTRDVNELRSAWSKVLETKRTDVEAAVVETTTLALAKLEIPQLDRASCPPRHVATGSAGQRRHISTSASPAPVASHTWTSFRRWTLASASFSFVLRQIGAGGRTACIIWLQAFARGRPPVLCCGPVFLCHVSSEGTSPFQL